MNFYYFDYLKYLCIFCDKYDVLFICDEIVIGFGCIGILFVVEYVDIELDILCIGKVLMGGMMIFFVILIISKVVIGISEGEVGVLMYGLIFMGNLLVCVIVCVSIDLLFE